MKEITGNIWDFHDIGHTIGITTNGSVTKKGSAVMGRGVALQAKQKFVTLPWMLADKIKTYGNVPFHFPELRLITIPVKHLWMEKADLTIITTSLTSIARWGHISQLYLVRPGCGSGGLPWSTVKLMIQPLLGNRFVIVDNSSG